MSWPHCPLDALAAAMVGKLRKEGYPIGRIARTLGIGTVTVYAVLGRPQPRLQQSKRAAARWKRLHPDARPIGRPRKDTLN